MRSIASIYNDWNESIRPLLPPRDSCALAESWNDYTDAAAKNGELGSLQYHFRPAHDDPMPEEGSQHDKLAGDRDYILEAMGLTMKTERRTRARAGWGPGASHWTVTLARRGESMRAPYSMGSAHTGQPDMVDVLGSLLLDANCAGESFADFCAELGMDTDTAEDRSKADRAYNACKRAADGLARLFTPAELDDLRELFEGR